MTAPRQYTPCPHCGRPWNSLGLAKGAPVRITGGRWPGREGIFVRMVSARQARVEIGAAAVSVLTKYIEVRK